MKACYHKWISKNVQEAYGKCAEVTLEMERVFPELLRVRGHYYCPLWGDREHWWLVDFEGNVVDPTASQFPSRGFGVYTPWEEDSPEPTGKCYNCGDYCYEGELTCSERCNLGLDDL